MMGRLTGDQRQLFYQFDLDEAVPEDHLVRKIDAALDLSWLRSELAPHYSSLGRPSIDPELMIRMLVMGYVFAIRSERLICREVQVKGAWTGPAALSLLPHALAPVADLPVLEIVSGAHIRADLTLGLGRVVYDYVQETTGSVAEASRRRIGSFA